MTPRKLLVHAYIFAFFVLAPGLQAQDSMRVVIISPRVGSTIDKAESEYYHIFQQMKGFRSAQFLVGTDGLYYARVSRTVAPGAAESDTIIEYPERSVFLMAEKIDHFEALTAGEYRMGSEPAQLESTGQSVGLQFVPQRSKADSSVRSRTPPQLVVTGPPPMGRTS